MKKPLASSFRWMLLCLALMAFGLLGFRVWLATSNLWTGSDPFAVSVAGVKAKAPSPRNVSDGYDRLFQIDFDVTGRKPDWWWQDFKDDIYFDPDVKGKRMKGWSFWLERGGKRTPFYVSKSIIWESFMNGERQGYSNEFAFHSGPVPTDAVLKARGAIQLVPAGYNDPYRPPYAPLAPPLSVVLTLKRAGEKWAPPVVSTNPGCVVNQVEISRTSDGASMVSIIAQGDKPDTLTQRPRFLDDRGRPILFVTIISGSRMSYSSADDLLPDTYELSWSDLSLAKTPQRNVTLNVSVAVGEKWPLEITFPVKKDGKSLVGIVPVQTHPRGQ